MLREPLANQARRNVAPTAWRKTDNDTHRPRRIVVGFCDPRDDRLCGGHRCQIQKLSTGKFHGSAPTNWHSQCNFHSQVSSNPLWRVGGNVAYYLAPFGGDAITVAFGGKADIGRSA